MIWNKSDENEEQLWNIRSNRGAFGEYVEGVKSFKLTVHMASRGNKVREKRLFFAFPKVFESELGLICKS